MLKRAVVLHHPQSEGAAAFSRQVAEEFQRREIEAIVSDAWADDAGAQIHSAGLVICVGGDGTVLRAARVTIPHDVPILGVNMGRLGFLTDLSPRDLFNYIERVIAMDWRIESRIMVRADLHLAEDDAKHRTYHALNDVVISRSSPGRPIYVAVSVDGAHVAVYRCDGIIVATPTGSTGYSLAAGGPIMSPTEHHLVLTPVSAHMALARSLVLQPDSVIELRVTSDHGAILSVDGQEDMPVDSGILLRVSVSEYITDFARFHPASSFYADLAEKLEFQLSSRTYSGG
jgi:NAD+ kinase